MRGTDPADWMWAQACDMLEEAQRMHRRFFRLAPAGPALPVVVAVWLTVGGLALTTEH